MGRRPLRKPRRPWEAVYFVDSFFFSVFGRRAHLRARNTIRSCYCVGTGCLSFSFLIISLRNRFRSVTSSGTLWLCFLIFDGRASPPPSYRFRFFFYQTRAQSRVV